jgi:hypothetical protein
MAGGRWVGFDPSTLAALWRFGALLCFVLFYFAFFVFLCVFFCGCLRLLCFFVAACAVVTLLLAVAARLIVSRQAIYSKPKKVCLCRLVSAVPPSLFTCHHLFSLVPTRMQRVPKERGEMQRVPQKRGERATCSVFQKSGASEPWL